MLGRLTSQVKRRLEPAQLRLSSGALVAAAALGDSQHAVWNFWILVCFDRSLWVCPIPPSLFFNELVVLSNSTDLSLIYHHISIRSEHIWTTFQHSYHSWDHQNTFINSLNWLTLTVSHLIPRNWSTQCESWPCHPAQVHGLKGGKEWNEQNGKVPGGRSSWGFFEK